MACQGQTPLPATQPEIRGAVVDAATGQAIAGARVRVTCASQAAPGDLTYYPDYSGDEKTDDAGQFLVSSYSLGLCHLTATKDGYVADAGSTAAVMAKGEVPARVRLTLSVSAGIAGRVIDDETGEPIPKIRVESRRVITKQNRRSIPNSGSDAMTGEDGRFVLGGLAPGDYLVSVGYQTAPGDRLKFDFSDKDAEAVERDFPVTLWPGGGGLDQALPVTLGASQTVDIGRIAVRRSPYYRLRLLVSAPGCAEGRKVIVAEAAEPAPLILNAAAPCAKEMLISGFPPGQHSLVIVGLGSPSADSSPAQTAVTAILPLLFVDKNLTVRASPEPGPDVEVKYEAADGATLPDLSALRVNLQGRTFPLFQREPAGKDGKALVANLLDPDTNITFSGLDAGHYIQALRYNGRTFAGPVIDPAVSTAFHLDASAGSQLLEVVIDDKAAAVAGVVTANDAPAPQPYVLLFAEPSKPGDQPAAHAQGDGQGKFHFAGVPPGEYRIAAVASAAGFEALDAAGLERLRAAAEKFELRPSAFQTVNLKLADLR
jgi:hypothetical protein